MPSNYLIAPGRDLRTARHSDDKQSSFRHVEFQMMGGLEQKYGTLHRCREFLSGSEHVWINMAPDAWRTISH
jgi:hypothetical protein